MFEIEPESPVDAQTLERKRAELARMAGRFRILIVGRANAGKTTILKKICNTTDDPEIYNSHGKKIDTSNIEPTAQRGIHDIENEMIFRSNPGFIFHDSRGFEAGGVDELQKVKSFVSERSREKKLADQIHVIWYCIPMNDSRPITNAEIQFFSRSATGKVPVIAIFTKCEALEVQAVEVLQEEKKLSYRDAVKGALEYAKQHLWNIHLELEKHKYPPRGHVYLQEMEQPHTDCKALVDVTASVLDSDTLQAIFISTQQASLELSVKYAIRRIIKHSSQKIEMIESASQDQVTFALQLLKMVMAYFPYWVVYRRNNEGYRAIREDQEIKAQDDDHEEDIDYFFAKFTTLEITSVTLVLVHLADIIPSPIQNQVIQLGSALVVIAEHLYFVWKHNRSSSPQHITSTIVLYQQSPTCAVVTGQVEKALATYSNSPQIAEPAMSAWKQFKDVLPKRKVKKPAKEPKDILEEMIFDTVMVNRLDKTSL